MLSTRFYLAYHFFLCSAALTVSSGDGKNSTIYRHDKFIIEEDDLYTPGHYQKRKSQETGVRHSESFRKTLAEAVFESSFVPLAEFWKKIKQVDSKPREPRNERKKRSNNLNKKKKGGKAKKNGSTGASAAGWVMFFILLVAILIALYIFCKRKGGWKKTRNWLYFMRTKSNQAPANPLNKSKSTKIVAPPGQIPTVDVAADGTNLAAPFNVTLGQPVICHPACLPSNVNAQYVADPRNANAAAASEPQRPRRQQRNPNRSNMNRVLSNMNRVLSNINQESSNTNHEFAVNMSFEFNESMENQNGEDGGINDGDIGEIEEDIEESYADFDDAGECED